MSMLVNLCVKDQEQCVNYHTKSFLIDSQEFFPKEIDLKEVISLPHKRKKAYLKVVKSFILTGCSFLTLSSRSMAATVTTPSQSVGVNVLPPDFLEPMITLLALALATAFVLAIFLMIASGVMRMFRQKDFSTKWNEDIIKGFTQILLAIPVIMLIYYVATKMLNVSEVFISPF